MLVYRLRGSLSDEERSAALWEAGATGLEERGPDLRAYFEAEVPLEGFPELAGGEWLIEPDLDWQAEWKRGLGPVTAGRLTLVPSWLRAEVPPGQQVLVIEPGMAFGTGHHATTRMAAEALGELELAGKGVLDVGTGSGVLAIAASLLGAGRALGLDLDPLTLPVARENAGLNGFTPLGGRYRHPVTGGELEFRQGTLEREDYEDDERWDVLVANLYAELHDLLAADYQGVLAPDAPLVLTGILTEKLPLVRAALEREGFSQVRERIEGEWALVTARSP